MKQYWLVIATFKNRMVLWSPFSSFTGCQAWRSRSVWDTDGNREWTGHNEGDVGNSVQLLQEQNFFVWSLWQ